MDNLDIYDLIVSKNLTWEGLLKDIIKKENINPWDIDVNFLSQKYKEAVKNIMAIDFKLSGKFLLASAILLRMKSDNFEVKELYQISTDYFDDFFEELNTEKLVEEFRNQTLKEKFKQSKTNINVKLPRQRVKPVNLEDLVDALKEAMVVKERRDDRKKELKERMNYKIDIVKVDIGSKIKNVFASISNFFGNLNRKEIFFKDLIPTKSRNDQIWTFVPLLHLRNQGKIDLFQKEQFKEIKITKFKND